MPVTTTGAGHTTQEAATGLAWGVKASLVAYVRRTGGDVRLFEGAGLLGDRLYHFGLRLAARDPAGDDLWQGRLQFDGGIQITAHGGLLHITLRELEIAIGPETALLTAAVATGPVPQRLTVMDLGPTSSTRRGDFTSLAWTPRLHADAVGLFGDVYAAGEQFDVLEARVPAAPA